MDDSQKRAWKRIEELQQELTQLKKSLAFSGDSPQPIDFPFPALVCEVNGFWISLPISQVELCMPMVWVSPLPQAPLAVRGTIVYHGQLVPVLDLHQALTSETQALHPEMFLVLFSGPDHFFALVVTKIEGVFQLTANDVDLAPQMSSTPLFVRCFLKMAGRTVILLDPENLLLATEMELLQDLIGELSVDTGATDDTSDSQS